MPPKRHNTLFKPHVNIKGGHFNIGVRTDIKLGGLHVKSSNNTKIGKSGYQHKESSSEGISGLFSNTRSNTETLNLNRHSTSQSQTSKINGFSESSRSESKISTWMSVTEEKSMHHRVNGLSDASAHQYTSTSLKKGYINQWSTHEQVGALSSDESHSLHVSRSGIQGTDTMSLHAGHRSFSHVSAPPILLNSTPTPLAFHAKEKQHFQPSTPQTRNTFYRPASNGKPKVTPAYALASAYPMASSNLQSTQVDESIMSRCFPRNGFFSFFCCFKSRRQESMVLHEEHERHRDNYVNIGSRF